MVQPGHMVVIDEDGRRGTIEAYYPPEKKFVVTVSDQQILIPADIITPGRDGFYTVPLRFFDLTQHHRDDEQAGELVVVPVIEEELRVGKRTVERGRVRVNKTVREHEEVIDEPLIEDRIEVERVPMNQLISEPLSTRVEGEITIVPVMKEVLVVQKQLMLVEEVRVRKTRTEVHRPQSIMLRKEEVHVERLGDEVNSPGSVE
jgi:uncharacterized protein (TIGR02271 family)